MSTISKELPGVRDETEIVRRAQGGDRRAFALLYRTHHRRVHALTLRMLQDRQLAEEATQDAFVEAWRGLRSFRGESAFSTWLCGVAVRRSLRTLRTERRRRDRRDGLEASAWPEKARRVFPGTTLDVERAVAALPERARATLLLHMAGFDHAEIASQLGVGVGTVKSQLHRARGLVLERMDA